MKVTDFKVDSFPYEDRHEIIRNNPEHFGMANIKTLEPLFTRGDVGIDLRKIYHWEQEGLLTVNNENREWRKYSFVDYVWIKIIEQLRELKVGLETIHKIKDDLFDLDEDVMMDGVKKMLNDPEYSHLWEREDTKELRKKTKSEIIEGFRSIGMCQLWCYIGATIHSRSPATILTTQHGVLGFFAWNEYGRTEKLTLFLELLSENAITIQINLFDIIRQFLKNDKIDIHQYYILDLLTENEKIIIDLIRGRRFNEVTIYQKNGEIERISTKERRAVKELTHQVYSLMQKGDYKKIEINVENGNVVTYTETKSIKIKRAKK